MDVLVLKAGDIIALNFNLKFVALSFFVSVVGSLVSLDFAAHIRKPGGGLNLWATVTSGTALGGVGIWAMHFIGMTAHEMPFRSSYSVTPTLLSLAVAILASIAALALVFSSNASNAAPVSRIVCGGLFAGLGVAGMHYIGMYAWQTQAYIVWDKPLVALSVAVAVIAASAALWLAFSLKSGFTKFGAALLMATAVCSMHYIGMYAGTIICSATSSALTSSLFQGRWLPYSVSIIAVVLLLVTTVVTMLLSQEDDATKSPKNGTVS